MKQNKEEIEAKREAFRKRVKDAREFNDSRAGKSLPSCLGLDPPNMHGRRVERHRRLDELDSERD